MTDTPSGVLVSEPRRCTFRPPRIRFPAPPPAPRPSVLRHGPPPPRAHGWGWRLGITAGLLAALGGALLGAKRYYLPDTVVLPGLAVDGERLPDQADLSVLRATVESHAKALRERKIALVLPGKERPVLEATYEELGLRVDIDRSIDVAVRAGKDGDFLTRAEAVRDARAGKADVPLFTRFDTEAALAKLEALKEREDTSAISARLDLDKHETVPERDGRYIDADGTIAALARALPDGRMTQLTLPVQSFAPRISSAYLKSLDISTVVAEYETFFSRTGDQKKRGKNIDNAAQKLDGVVISPGELMSFNEIVGERSEANGFEKSWEIFKGEMVEGVGGGTCQVASTFHAATFFGGFDVLERLPHSRPSAYIPMGLDSTVVYPAVDLKVRNPHPFPIVVHASSSNGKLRVELLGKMRPARVSFGREVVSTIAYKRKIEEDPALTGKKVLVKQHGIKGFKIKRSRLFTYPNGTTKKEETTDSYPPTVEIYKVPPGFDESLLPALPTGEDEEPEIGASTAAPVAATTRAPSDATASTGSPSPDVELIDAPGAHAPSAAQRDPAKMIWVKR